jgi:hypothetical protein
MVRIRRRHVIHSLVLVAVLTQLSFAGLFLADLASTSATYNTLVVHRVPVTAQLFRCFNVTTVPEKFTYDNCYVNYKYRGEEFHAWIDQSWSLVFYVDPYNSSIRMNKSTFDSATENIDSDTLFVVLLLLGAILTAAAHQIQMYRLRKERRLVLAVHEGDHRPHGHEHRHDVNPHGMAAEDAAAEDAQHPNPAVR